MIALFGTKRCKFCNIQKDFFEKTFGKSSNWVYVDILKNNNNLK
jgi:hypothetical protein